MRTVCVENISKSYLLKHRVKDKELIQNEKNKNIWRARTVFSNYIRQRNFQSVQDEFLALDDVSFDINEGERVGIIGKNGAGKSTLLKILSRITEPTSGRMRLKGRVASLLEVGTGFNPELTGRENVFLNGAILGMSRNEIARKFEEIVAFAEVEKFLETPVKHYSSGMYMRLAFAVAAHLEPEILIVDEVLAVGDAQFQRKCLGKMEEVGRSGRTILFVSHNMQAVRQLCDRGIYLKSGRIITDGSVEECISDYMSGETKYTDADLPLAIESLPDDPVFKLCNIEILQNGFPVRNSVVNGSDLHVKVQYKVRERTTGLRIYLDLTDDQGNLLFRTFNDEDNDGIPTVQAGNYTSIAVIPANLLAPTSYRLVVYSTIYNVRSLMPDGITFYLSVMHTGMVNRAYMSEPIRGKLAPLIHWENLQPPESI